MTAVLRVLVGNHLFRYIRNCIEYLRATRLFGKLIELLGDLWDFMGFLFREGLFPALFSLGKNLWKYLRGYPVRLFKWGRRPFKYALKYLTYTWLGMVKDWDVSLFVVVMTGTFWALRRAHQRRKLESATTFWHLLSYGVRAAGIVAGLFEFGRFFLPAKLAVPNAIADLLRILGDVFSDSTRDPRTPGLGTAAAPSFETDGTTLDLRPGKYKEEDTMASLIKDAKVMFGEEDPTLEALEVVGRLKRAWRRLKEYGARNAKKVSCFLVGVVVGVFIFCWLYRREVIKQWIGEHVVEPTRDVVDASKQKVLDFFAMLRLEAKKGKNKRGLRTKKLRKYDLYPDEDWVIEEVFYNGEPIGRGARALVDPGVYVVQRYNSKTGRIKEEVFEIDPNADMDVGAPGDEYFPRRGRKNDSDFDQDMDLDEVMDRRARVKGKGPKKDDEDLEGKAKRVPVYQSAPVVRDCKVHGHDMQVSVAASYVSQDGAEIITPILETCRACGERRDIFQKSPVQQVKELTPPLEARPPVVPPPVPPRVLPPPPNLNGAPKLEALVPSAPKVDYKPVQECQGEMLDSVGRVIQQCLGAWCGVIVNKHSLKDCTHLKFGGKIFPVPTKVTHESFGGNTDVCILKSFDGAPRLKKARFAVPEKGGKVWVLAPKLSNGVIETVDELGPYGRQMRATVSTVDGDCGSPYVNVDGRVVGIHFSAGKEGRDNLAAPVTDEVLLFQPKN